MKNFLGFIAILISSTVFSQYQYYNIYVSRYEAGYSDCYKEVTGRRPQSIPSLRREPTSTEVVDRNLAYNRGCSEGKRDAEDDGGSSRRQTAQLEYPTLSASDIAYARALGQARAQEEIYNRQVEEQYRIEKKRQASINAQYIAQAQKLDEQAEAYYKNKDYSNSAKYSLDAFKNLNNVGISFVQSWRYLYNAIVGSFFNNDNKNVEVLSINFLDMNENNNFPINTSYVENVFQYYITSLITLKKTQSKKKYFEESIRKYQKIKDGSNVVGLLKSVIDLAIPREEILDKIKTANDVKQLEEILKIVDRESRDKKNKIYDESFISDVYRAVIPKFGSFNHFEKAIEYTTKLIDLHGKENNPNLVSFRISLYEKINDNNKAIEDYDFLINNYNSLKYKPYDLATLYNNKAYKYILMKQPNEARSLINRALELDQSKNYIWDTKGEMEYLLGNYDEAISNMSKAISIGEAGNSFLYRGLSYLKLNNKKQACSDFFKAGELGKKEGYDLINQHCK